MFSIIFFWKQILLCCTSYDSYGGGNKIRNRGHWNKLLCRGALVQNCEFYFPGNKNSIHINEKATIRGCKIWFQSSFSNAQFEENTLFRSSLLYFGDSNNDFIMRKNSDMGEECKIYLLEGTTIDIGEDCMFAGKIVMMSSDMHAIIDNSTGSRTNCAKDIIIGKHVWFGSNVTCLKGVQIPCNVMVGNGSMLTAREYYENSVYAGNPAKLVRENITWTRER